MGLEPTVFRSQTGRVGHYATPRRGGGTRTRTAQAPSLVDCPLSYSSHSPKGSRTPVAALKGRGPCR